MLRRERYICLQQGPNSQHELWLQVDMVVPCSRDQDSCTWIASSAHLLDIEIIYHDHPIPKDYKSDKN